MEATGDTPFLASLAQEAEDLLDELEPKPGLARRARKAMGDLTVALSVGPASIAVTSRTTPDEAAVDVPTARLLTSLGRAAAERGTGVVLLLDELQAIPKRDLKAIARAMQAVEGDRLPVLLVGAGLPDAPDHLRAAVTYGERYKFTTLGPLSPVVTRVALERPARHQDVAYEPAALDHLVTTSDGYPYLVQLLGRHAWDVADGADTITAAHAEVAARSAVTEFADAVLRNRWRRLAPSERTYVIAMAALGPIAASGQVAADLGRTAQQLSSVRSKLITKSVIVAVGERELAFAMPGFRSFVLQEQQRSEQGAAIPAHDDGEPPHLELDL